MHKKSTLDHTTLYRQIEVLKETVNRLQSTQERDEPALDSGKQETIRGLRLRLQAAKDMLEDYERRRGELSRRARNDVEDMNIDFKEVVRSLAHKP
ncbi:MAG: hypothetical protein RRA35_01025 [Desulfomonilia bacterium]|nr:hypothetical protein [Desulfomonilia bacterium]